MVPAAHHQADLEPATRSLATVTGHCRTLLSLHAWRHGNRRADGRAYQAAHSVSQACNATAIRRACVGGTHSAFRSGTRRWAVYSILYIIGAIVVIIVVLRLL